MKEIKDVFISYGRKESLAFSNKLYNRLVDAGYSAWYDHVNIPKGDDFQRRIDNGIEMAHSFVFIIAPHAVKSEFCLKEVELAVRLKKRIIPILHIEQMSKEVWNKLHPVLSETNWIYGREEPDAEKALADWRQIDDFDQTFRELHDLLETDKAYVQQHTEILCRALQWRRSHRTARELLDEQDLGEAENWLTTRFIPPHQPPCLPASIHAEYITESKKATEHHQTDVFLAYARPDADIMTRFNDYLIQRGVTTWIDTKDVKKDIKFEEALELGIQEADNVIFFISPSSMTSPFLQRELELSLTYKKRIIPVLIQETDYKTMLDEVKQLTYIDFSKLGDADYERGLGRVYDIIRSDREYHRLHKTFLTKALTWERRQKKSDFLLEGDALTRASAWLREGVGKAKESGPTSLHKTYIREGNKQTYKESITGLDVAKDAFISYNRGQSLEFVWDLYMRLTDDKLEVWFDQNDIPLGVDFQNQIDQGIIKADNFIFVMSPGSISSIYCLKEILLAVQYGKRIIPLLHIMPENEDWERMRANVETLKAEAKLYNHPSSDAAVETMQKLNWIYFREGVDDFEASLEGLTGLMQVHADYVKQHTNLLALGLEWQRHQRGAEYLLVGEERIKSEAWLVRDFDTSQPPCRPSDVHAEFICESKKNANNLMTEAFICYAAEDRPIRDKVRISLAKHGVTTWIHDKDIYKGKDYGRAIEEGIEQADNLLFFISPLSVKSDYCLIELEHALKFNKRIIPLLIHETPVNDRPEQIRKLQYVDFTDNIQAVDYDEDIDEILANFRTEEEYYHQHKVFLVQALKWSLNDHNKSFLLRGFNLNKAEAWLKIGRKLKDCQPTDLHEEFIAESQQTGASLTTDVFLSYSRANSDFARKLNEQLQIQGKTTWFDQESIASGADFAAEINRGIENADNFLFVLTPHSIQSEYCAGEVEHAAGLGKRFITVLCDDINPEDLHPELAKVQWIDFRPDATGFSVAFGDLINTLDTDLAHVRMHTRLQMRQQAWSQKSRDKSLLLYGSELREAETWLTTGADKEPLPTARQQDYIVLSRHEVRRKRRTLYAAIAFLLIVTILAITAIIKAREANRQRLIAEEQHAEALRQRNIAEEQRAAAVKQKAIAEDNARIAEEQRLIADEQRHIAEAAHQESERLKVIAEEHRNQAVNSEISLRLASVYRLQSKNDRLSALHESLQAGFQVTSADVPDYQYLDTIEALNTTFREAAEYNRLSGHGRAVRDVHISPTGDRLASTDPDGTLRIWSADGQPLLNFQGHEGLATRLQFSRDGSQIVSVGWDQMVRLWDADGQLQKEFHAHDGIIWDVKYSPDGEHIATAGKDNAIKIWDRSGSLRQTLSGHLNGVTRLSFHPHNNSLVSASWDGTIRAWDIETGQESTLVNNPEETFTDVAFNPDGSKMATINTNKMIQIWTISTSSTMRADLAHTLTGHSAYIAGMDWSPDGELIVTASKDKTVKLWRSNGELLTTLEGHEESVNSVSFHPDGRSIASASDDRTVRLWSLENILNPPAESSDLDELLKQGCEWLHEYLQTAELGSACDEKLSQR